MKNLLKAGVLAFLMILSGQGISQSAKSSKDSKNSTKTICCSTDTESAAASGCAPSACRGVQTKFGEAKVITSLRQELINLKAEMEMYKSVNFDERSYSLQGIVGETDDESISIIAEEVKAIERSFTELLGKTFSQFSLPERKAKQVIYLGERIKSLAAMLKA